MGASILAAAVVAALGVTAEANPPAGQRTVPTGPATLSSAAGGVLAVGAAKLYSFGANGTVVGLPKAGGPMTTLASGQIGSRPFPSVPVAIAADATNVFWSKSGTISNNYTDGSLWRVPIRGGPPVSLLSGQPMGTPAAIALDASNIYWTEVGVTVAGGARPGAS
jgi:hypothetical protein